MSDMMTHGGATTPDRRRMLAAKAFSRTSAYDSAISSWFNSHNKMEFPAVLTLSGQMKQSLHYGENPHQRAAFYRVGNEPSLASAMQVQGSELSYNNLNDASAAFELVQEFDQPAVVIVKHANPCGVAVGENITEAFLKALACDPISAYGGIIATNRTLDKSFCEALGKLFLEVMIAPDADEEAKQALFGRKKLKLLLSGNQPKPAAKKVIKSISGGFLYQDEDNIILKDAVKTVTHTPADSAQMDDMLFAFTVAKHVKSNTIVLVKDRATVGIGAGQMSRIDSTRIACWKAKEAGLDTKGCVLATDAFFPFPDNVEMAAEAGINAIIQPGGSIRDNEVIEAADKAGIAMVFTGIRHFRH
jgi:phosphoribosylaminoimidazolecarboxamide formyltransferase/IMP cyclohydrolase